LRFLQRARRSRVHPEGCGAAQFCRRLPTPVACVATRCLIALLLRLIVDVWMAGSMSHRARLALGSGACACPLATCP